jgi:hypothetical protein
MTNLIGDEINDYEQWLTVPGATVHLYGKGRRGPGPQNGACHGHDAQSECQRHADQTDADLRKTGGDDRAAASGKCEPERAGIASRIWLHISLRARPFASRNPRFALPEVLGFFVGPLTFQSDQLKEDAACRFSFAITMSTKPSRR